MTPSTFNKKINFIANDKNLEVVYNLLKENNKLGTRSLLTMYKTKRYKDVVQTEFTFELLVKNGPAYYIDLSARRIELSKYTSWDSEKVHGMVYEMKINYSMQEEDFHQQQYLYDFGLLEHKHISKLQKIFKMYSTLNYE